MLGRQTGGDHVSVAGRRYRQVHVNGHSMRPTLTDGDLVLVKLDTPVQPDDLVLVRWPERPGQLSVKRAMWPEEGGWFVVGDNVAISEDSNRLGPATVLGVIRWRLWPRPWRVR
jgi:phage repressor protein C with HTH and peptisase S24 domain